MEIPVWFLSLTVIGIGGVAGYGYRYLLSLVEKSTEESKSARDSLTKKLDLDMKELRRELYSRMSISEDRIVNSINKISTEVVPRIHCNGKQEIWTERFEHMINTIKTTNNIRQEADQMALDHLGETLLVAVGEIKSLRECVNKLSAGKEC